MNKKIWNIIKWSRSKLTALSLFLVEVVCICKCTTLSLVKHLLPLHFVTSKYRDILVLETKHVLQKRAVFNRSCVILLSASQLAMKDIILFSATAKVTIKEPPDTVQPEGHK
jgi:hypothetical protein